jgi:tetratricopeptide (TPR) repeat protein
MKRSWASVLVCASLALLACGRDASEFVSRAEAAHRKADLFLAAGDANGAREALKAVAESDPPSGAHSADARVVRQDLYYRLAELELSQNRAEAAAAWASSGLGLGEARDVFTANLHIARGRALERTNDARGASEDYHRALLISEALLDESLGQGNRKP